MNVRACHVKTMQTVPRLLIPTRAVVKLGTWALTAKTVSYLLYILMR